MFDETGKTYGAYTLVERKEMEDLHGVGYIFSHNKTKARVAVISNDDDNKVFDIAFRTPVYNNTGVPHIMEHSVLCGSEKFPIKDPFVELVKGSLNTFLNAMTYPDKTVYPVASCNDKDFQNLMDVYLDAVFHPNIYKYPQIMQQEGWHYELESEDSDIIYNGVVYNEMKGVYSSPQSVLERECMASLFPDNTYAYESGGYPAEIPELTYEQFIEFHKTFYHPSNSYIYIYGDMDVQEKLDFIDKEYLSNYDYLEVDSEIATQAPLREMRDVRKEYAISNDEDEAEKTFISYNVVLDENIDAKLDVAFKVIEYMLMDVPGAPLKKALIDAGLSKDVDSGYETSIKQPVFTIGLSYTDEDKKDKFMQVLRDTLNGLVKDGLDEKALLAAINRFEFQYRESNFGAYPKGLILGLRMYDSWLYDENQAFEYMNVGYVFDELKCEVKTGYFESVIEKYLLNNPHSSLVTLAPKKGLGAEEDEKVAKKLAEKKANMSREQLSDLVQKTKDLKAFQEREDKEEDLLKIPLLTLEDLGTDIKESVYEERVVNGVKYVMHDVFTNGIVYATLMFDMTGLPERLISSSSLYTCLLRQVDTANYSYNDLSSEIDLATGGVSFVTSVYKKTGDTDGYNSVFSVSFKCLKNQFTDALNLIEEILFTSNLADKKRIKDIIEEQRASMKPTILNGGNLSMLNRAYSTFDQAYKYREKTDLIDYYDYLIDASDNYEDRVEQLISDFKEISDFLLTKEHLTVSYGYGEDMTEEEQKAVEEFYEKLSDAHEDGVAPVLELTKGNEAFKTSSQVQYVVSAGRISNEEVDKHHGNLNVLKMIFSYEYLWMNVRVKGGAYGCGFSFSKNGLAGFTSYRDPNFAGTLDVYSKAADYVANFDVDDRTMLKYIIGTISNVDAPVTPASLISRSLGDYRSGLTNERRKKDRDQILATTQKDIRELAPLIKQIADYDAFAVVGNEDKIEAEGEGFVKRQLV